MPHEPTEPNSGRRLGVEWPPKFDASEIRQLLLYRGIEGRLDRSLRHEQERDNVQTDMVRLMLENGLRGQPSL